MKWFWQREKKPKREKTIPEGAVRRHLRYSGKVQNVGFRFTAQNHAESRGLTGWVLNRSDGDVELEVQGTPEQIDAFLADIREESERPKAWIHAVLVENQLLDPIPDDRFTIKNLY